MKTYTETTISTCQKPLPQQAPVLPDTINIFLTAACNFRCAHCYATFADIRGTAPRFMSQELVQQILRSISREPLPPGLTARKITFVGGEPTLCHNLVRFVATAKSLGLDTAVITNGTRITPAYLDHFAGTLDWMGFSIDSFDERTNRAIGRCSQDGIPLTTEDYFLRLGWVQERGIGLKLNTVVNAFNWQEDMTPFLVKAYPDRWKVLQVTPIAGQNDDRIAEMQITRAQFQHFVDRHSMVRQHGITMVAEPVEVIRGSYAMISPDGRFFGNAQGRHIYSDFISKAGVRKAFSQVTFHDSKFHSRGGRYERVRRCASSSVQQNTIRHPAMATAPNNRMTRWLKTVAKLSWTPKQVEHSARLALAQAQWSGINKDDAIRELLGMGLASFFQTNPHILYQVWTTVSEELAQPDSLELLAA